METKNDRPSVNRWRGLFGLPILSNALTTVAQTYSALPTSAKGGGGRPPPAVEAPATFDTKSNGFLSEIEFAEALKNFVRMSSSILGDGYIACVGDADLIANRDSQYNTPFGNLHGLVLPVKTTIGIDHPAERVGRFGWNL